MVATCTLTTYSNWSSKTFAIGGLGTASGADGVLVSGTLTPTVSPAWTVGALAGRWMKLGATTYYAIASNTATSCVITSPPADNTYAYLLGGPPLATDNVYLNAYSLTLDGGNGSTYTCAEIRATQSNGTTVTAGEIILNNATSTIAANIIGGNDETITMTGKTLTINGNITNNSATNGIDVIQTVSGANVLTVNGNVTGGANVSHTSCPGITVGGGTTTLSISGTVTGGATTGNHGLNVAATVTTTIVSAVGGSIAGAHGVLVNSAAAVVTVTSAKGGGVLGASGLNVNNGTGILNGTDLTGTGYPVIVNFGTLKIADGVVLAFSDKTSGLIKFYSPSLLPPVADVTSTTTYGNGDFVGTLDLSTYTLISGVVAAGYVLTGHNNYSGGSAGSLTLPSGGTKVLTSESAFGVSGTSITPSATLPLNTKVLNDQTYGVGGNGSTGTLTLPANGSKVLTTESAFGVAGSSITPAFDLTVYTLKSGVVDAANVVVGYNNYTGGSAGAYPTTTTSQAAQLVTDQAAVTAAVAGITTTTTILTVTGTLNLTTYENTRNTDPGIGAVALHTNYTIHGSALVGTLVVGGGGAVHPIGG